MNRAKLGHSCILALAALTVASPAAAHGLLLSATGEQNAIVGRVSYSDGTPGAGEFIELRDLATSPPRSKSCTADAAGGFRFPAQAGHRYALVAHGEEGHSTEVRLTLAPGARGQSVGESRSIANGDELGGFRALLIIAALLATFVLVAGGRQIHDRRRSRYHKSN